MGFASTLVAPFTTPGTILTTALSGGRPTETTALFGGPSTRTLTPSGSVPSLRNGIPRRWTCRLWCRPCTVDRAPRRVRRWKICIFYLFILFIGQSIFEVLLGLVCFVPIGGFFSEAMGWCYEVLGINGMRVKVCRDSRPEMVCRRGKKIES